MQNHHFTTSLFAITASVFALGCGPDALDLPPLNAPSHEVQFVGGVFDAASGQRLTDYSIEVVVAGEATIGTVSSSNGHFLLGPVGAFDDYSVHIPLTNYREFWSHNSRIGLPAGVSDPTSSTSQTRYFDAYMFPSNLETVAATISIRTPEAGEVTAGTFRMRPTGVSSISDSNTETPAGVNGQVWQNDEDLLGGAVAKDFDNSQVELEAGELIYGVEYQVDIYAVDGYQPYTLTYRAGIDTDKSVVLAPDVVDPLALVASNDESCTAPGSPTDDEAAVVTIEFNYPIESADPGNAELLDDNLSISSPNSNANSATNTLNTDMSDNTQERGTSMEFSGTKLTLKFSPNTGLAEKDSGDDFNSVTYGGLAGFVIRRAGNPDTEVALASLLGKGSIVCDD